MQDRDSDWLTAELVELIGKGARFGHGLAFVRHAPLETVATSLGVCVDVVDHARECLQDPERRARLEREYVRERERPRAPTPTSTPPPPSAPADVIGHAERHPLGVQFLLCAPLETVAIAFAVHPDLVCEARAELTRRGITPEPGEA